MCFICDMDDRHGEVGSGIIDDIKASFDKHFLQLERNELLLLTTVHLFKTAVESTKDREEKIKDSIEAANNIFGDIASDKITELLEIATNRNLAALKDIAQGKQRKSERMGVVEMSPSELMQSLEEILGLKPNKSDKNKH